MRSFLGFGQLPYIGQTFTLPIKLAGISGQTIPLLFQWLSYGASTAVPNINVAVDFDNPVCKAFDQIRSVYIDNLGSSVPVYVYFPDTGYTLSAKANSEGWYPAFTNAKKIWVIGQGFLTGSIPQTKVILCNIPLPPSVNVEIDQSVELWKASPVIARGTSIYNTNFGTPALGDQFYSSGSLDLTGPSIINSVWGTPYPDGFIYVNNVQFNAFGLFSSGSVQAQFVLESTGVGGILLAPAFDVTSPTAATGVLPILTLQGMNIKLDATQSWRLRNAGSFTQGFIQMLSCYTKNPT